MNDIALKVIMIIPTLLLQKPSVKSKTKQHSLPFQRFLQLWWMEELDEIIREVKHIQVSFKPNLPKQKESENFSKTFAKLMGECKVSAALKLLDNTSAIGLLPLTEEVMRKLKKKHFEPATIQGDPLLREPI